MSSLFECKLKSENEFLNVPKKETNMAEGKITIKA